MNPEKPEKEEAEETEGLMKTQVLATEYMMDFAKKIIECRNVDDYYILITSVLVFAKLVRAQFKEAYQIDSSHAERMLIELDVAAAAIADSVLESVEKEAKKDLN